MFLQCLIPAWVILQRDQVLNWINYHLLFSFSPSLPFLYTWATAQGWRSFLQMVLESDPSSLACDQDLADAPAPLLDYCTVLFTWPFQYLIFPWSDPKHCCQNLVHVHPVTYFWRLISEHHLPASLACCFLISISPWLNLAAVPNILAAYHLVYRLHLPFPLTSPPVPSLHLLLSWLPPASMACTLDGRIPLCLAASLNIFLAFGNINASSFKILCIPTDFQQSCFRSHTDFQGASAPPLFL